MHADWIDNSMFAIEDVTYMVFVNNSSRAMRVVFISVLVSVVFINIFKRYDTMRII